MGQDFVSPDGTDPASGYGYPSEVPLSKVLAFLADIGVEPVDPNTLVEVNISTHGVRFTRLRIREHPSGKRGPYTTADGGNIAEQITTARIAWKG